MLLGVIAKVNSDKSITMQLHFLCRKISLSSQILHPVWLLLPQTNYIKKLFSNSEFD